MRVGRAFEAPSGEFLLGTDQVGRDVLSRVIHGSRISLRVSVLAVLLGAVGGTAVGLTSGYLGGRYDMWVQRVMDVLQAFPMIIMALVIVAVLGASSTNVILAIAIPMFPRLSRVVRSSALTIRDTPYVTAALSTGCSQVRILLRHVLPNTFAPLIIMATLQLGTAIIVEASLSYLGLGAQEPEASWGLMLAGSAATYAERSPWIPMFPGLALSLAVFAVNTLGDTARDVLDPRLRGR
jgi:peptide/nickel transport system permease protein